VSSRGLQIRFETHGEGRDQRVFVFTKERFAEIFSSGMVDPAGAADNQDEGESQPEGRPDGWMPVRVVGYAIVRMWRHCPSVPELVGSGGREGLAMTWLKVVEMMQRCQINCLFLIAVIQEKFPADLDRSG
jgi:hypothetical protein